MKKSIQFLSILLALTLILSIIVSAAGDSTTSRDTTASNTENESEKSTDDSTTETETTNCETITTREERIKCRLVEARQNPEKEKREYNYESTDLPESCMRLAEKTGNKITTKEECRRLYNSLQPCYSMSGIEKPRCFKEKAGLSGAALKPGDSQKVRHYIVALLYDIQEKVEKANIDGTISDDDAAKIIELILEIKEDLMNGETRDVIRPKMRELKSLLQEARQVTNE